MITASKCWKWSPPASILAVCILIMWLSSVVWSQNQNFGGVTGSGLAANSPGIPTNNGKSIFYATNYGVKAGGYKFCDAQVASATNVVTIGNDVQQKDPSLLTLGITTSWIAWVSTWNCAGFTNFVMENAVGTVVSVDSATQLHLSTTSSGSCAANGGTASKCTLYLFPQDDTAAIQATWNASTVQGTCGEMHLWSGLALLSTLPLASTGGCAANNTGNGSWPGVSVVGEGINASVLVINPNAATTSCTANSGCLFAMPATGSTQNDIHLQGFSIDGGGQPAPTGNCCEAIQLNADSSLEDVGLFAWGINNGVGTLGSNNAPVLLTHLVEAGMGVTSSGYELNAGQATIVNSCNLFWGLGGLAQFSGNSSFGQTYSNGCQFGYGNTNMVVVPSGKVHVSQGDYCNNQPGNTEACFDVTGVLDIGGAVISLPAGTGDIGVRARSGSAVVFHGTNYLLESSASGIGLQVDSGGEAIDTGIFVNTSVTPYSIAGLFIPNPQEVYPASISKVGATGTGACATITTITGNIFTGSLKCTGTTGVSTIVLTPGITATNGWNCTGADITTSTILMSESAFAVGSCTLTTGAVVANDIITFSLTQF